MDVLRAAPEGLTIEQVSKAAAAHGAEGAYRLLIHLKKRPGPSRRRACLSRYASTELSWFARAHECAHEFVVDLDLEFL
jgi:hypothetical protein